MTFYPVFLNLVSKLVLLVGGGQVAARKLAVLKESGAIIRLVAPELIPEIEVLLPDPQIEYRAREFLIEDLDKVWLVICATDIEDVNLKIAFECKERYIFVNIVDLPLSCSFIVPAFFKRGDLMLAISTAGASPLIARRIREYLETEFSLVWGPYLRLMRKLRHIIIASGKSIQEIRLLFFTLADSGLFSRVAAGDISGIDFILNRILGPGYSLAEIGWSAEDFIPKS